MPLPPPRRMSWARLSIGHWAPSWFGAQFASQSQGLSLGIFDDVNGRYYFVASAECLLCRGGGDSHQGLGLRIG